MRIPRLSRKRIIISVVLLTLFGAALMLPPVLIRHAATTWLQEHGIAAASIRDVDLNPFTATLAVEGLDAGNGLKIGRLLVDLDWWPLIHHRLSIHRLTLGDTQLQLTEGRSGSWLPAGLVLPPETAAAAPDGGPPLQPILHSVELRRVNITLDSKSLHLSLPIRHLSLHLAGQKPDGSQQLAAAFETDAAGFRTAGLSGNYASMYMNATISLPPLGDDLLRKLSVTVADAHVGLLKLATRDDSDHPSASLSVGGIHLQHLAASPKAAELALLDMTDVGAGSDSDTSLGSVGRIRAKLVRLERTGKVSLDSLAIDGADLTLLRQQDGRFAVPGIRATATPAASIPTAEAAPAAAPATAATGKPPLQLDIGRLQIASGSRLTFRDESVTPAFEKRLTVGKFDIAPIAMSGDTSAAVDLQLKVDGQGELNVSGSALPNADNPAADLDIKLKRLDMASLSSYTVGRFGQAIQTGQLDMQSKVKLAGAHIDAQNALTLRKLVLKAASEPGKAAGVGMPMDMALDMLRDSRGDIQLKVPVTGDLNDPKVNFSDAINQALMYAMQAGAVQYASQFLQPYGSLITVAKLAGKVAVEAAKPRLTPVRFAGQTSGLSADMQAYSGKIAGLLKAKDFRLEVCGIATRTEAKADVKAGWIRNLDDNALLQLAAKRSETVIKALTDQGISSDRLFHCRDTIDEGKKAVPRAELILD